MFVFDSEDYLTSTIGEFRFILDFMKISAQIFFTVLSIDQIRYGWI